jgi:dihydroflavonol-4-reductase
MRVFVTGGAGFIGTTVVRELARRGDSVTGVVRRPADGGLGHDGAVAIAGDLSDVDEITEQVRGFDALIHLAGSYRVGIAPSERRAMWEANVGATQRVLRAAVRGGVGRIVYVSTVNVFGNTRGRYVDESYVRDPRQGFLSWYDETKWQAHLLAVGHVDRSDPVMIAMPGEVYGPGDRSQVGAQLQQAFDGTLRFTALDDVRLTWMHVDDLAAGLLALLDRGRTGDSYVLAGPGHRLRDAMTTAAFLGGHLPPASVPTAFLGAIAPLADRLGPRLRTRLGVPANLREAISASAGVSYLATSAKAQAELGFNARDLRTGLRDWLIGSPDPGTAS